MKRRSFLIAIICSFSTSACATLDADRPTLEYNCGDLVAVGRVHTLGYTPIDDPNDLLGHGIFDLNVAIKRVVKGRSPTRIVRATTIAHAQMVESKDFLLVLKPKGDGSFELEGGSLTSHHPKLMPAARCDEAS